MDEKERNFTTFEQTSYDFNQTALHVAVGRTDVSEVKRLLESGADPNA